MSKSGISLEFRTGILDDDFEHKKLKKICAEFKRLADEIEDVPSRSETLKVCKRLSFKNLAMLLQNPHTVSVVAYFRAFAWQLCTEFGWFPTIKVDGGAIDDAAIPLSYFFRFFTDACRDVFGNEITASTIANAVKRTNELYGGSSNYSGTNLMILNGSEDPIHPLSLYDTPNDTVKSIIVPDISHTKDLRGDSDSDPQSLKNARERVKAEIEKWLNASVAN
ncbi:serine carboxypeptidase s28 domain-containing protein [Ditylenchus destructor]|uniref:Serine carboxypeptidase s28 domain-containing protein n=1 Tax=Ditylenchus destructor TaxID=166010 RepID=A0AAD4R519_9BILA|nr:serine carboxypeptidase s28 domain-containing protein [Ditylenchus destructor]